MKLKSFKKLIKVTLFTLSVFSAGASANEQVGRISGEVSINVKEEKLSAKLKYDYISRAQNESSIKLFLNDKFTITKVKCKICKDFEFDAKARRPTLTIQLNEPLLNGRRLPLEIEYSGSLSEMYNREHRFLELGLDWFWYPVNPSFDVNFLFSINVKTDISDFELISNGKTFRKGKNWVIESTAPDFDIDLILSDKLKIKSFREKGYDLQIVSKSLPDEVSGELLKDMIETLDFYNNTFGKNNPQKKVTGVFRPVNLDFGYFRKGYFVLNSPQKATESSFSISHELAHFWWSKAPRQHHWLNESFAEISAMIATRKFKGIEEFNKHIEKKNKNNVNLPAVYGFDRDKNPKQSAMVLYVKGALKLVELERELGEERFLQFLQIIADQEITETDRLIEELRKFSSEEIAGKFLADLKK